MYSGSEAEASQRLLRMKMLGLDRRSFTLWKKNFSYRRTHTQGGTGCRQVCMQPDAECNRWEGGYKQRLKRAILIIIIIII